MSWLDIKVWLEEQRHLLEGAFVDNVFVMNNAIVLRLRCRSLHSHPWLIIEPGRRISITYAQIKPQDSHLSGKQQMWRRMVRDCVIQSVEQLDLERVVFFNLRCGNEIRKLVAELLPRGIACVLNEEGRIVLITESRSMKDRVLKPGVVYSPPPTRKPFTEMSMDELIKMLSTGRDLIRGLIRGWGLPPEVAEAIVQMCNVEKSLSPMSVDSNVVKCLKSRALELVEKVVKKPDPCIVYVDDSLHGFYPFTPPTHSGAEIRKFEKFNDAVDEYFRALLERELSQQVLREVEAEISKLQKSVEDIEHRVALAQRELEEVRQKLEVLETRYAMLDELHRCVVYSVKVRGWDSVLSCINSVEVDVKVSRVEPSKGLYVVSINGIELTLDVRRDLVEIYNDLRRRVSELENIVKRALEEKEKLMSKINELRLRSEVTRKKIRYALQIKPEWYERFHWMYTSTGFLVIAGRDASQNMSLLRRYAEPDDIVMHADVQGASTVIIKTGGREVDEETLREAAVLAACYSKAWKAGYGAIDVFWVQREQVSFSAPSGEYLPKGSFMVYGKKNYIRGVRLELAIGIESYGDRYRVIVGPESTVAKRALAYMVLIPGDVDPSSIAKSFVEKLRESGLREVAELIDVNEVLVRIPGRSKIVKYLARKA